MAHQIEWTKRIVEEFIRLSNLTEDEEMILRTRALKGWSRTQQQQALHMSMSTVDRLIASLKRKYDIVQKESDILPPRRYSKQEEWMDNN